MTISPDVWILAILAVAVMFITTAIAQELYLTGFMPPFGLPVRWQAIQDWMDS